MDPLQALEHIGRRFEGARGWVNDAALSPAGDLLAAASEDRCAHVWDVASGALLLSIKHETPAHFVAFARDGRSLAVGVAHQAQIYPLDLEMTRGDPAELLRAAEGAAGVELDAFQLRARATREPRSGR